GHLINHDYVRAAADILTGPYGDAQAAANRLPNRGPVNVAHARAMEERRAALLRQHTAESQLYDDTPHRRASERVVPRRIHTDLAAEYEHYQPLPRWTDLYREETGIEVEGRVARRRSEMAGLVSEGGGGRVGNWLEHVEDDDD
ncbi:MAG: hypothetical protein M1835_003428, partial [Candelina submexicana]